MVTRHLTSKEFEMLIDGKKDQLNADCFTHIESCQQCRQEFSELSAIFHWPTATKIDSSAPELTEQVFAQLSRQKRTSQLKRIMFVLAGLLGTVLLIAVAPVLWQYVPDGIRSTTVGLFPVMEWVGSFNDAFSTISWFSLSAYSLLIGGLLVLSLIMLADSMVISRVIRRIKPGKRLVAVSAEQTTQGNRT